MAVVTLVGTLTTISTNMINPYDGSTVYVEGDFYVNTTPVFGSEGILDYLLGNPQDNDFRLEGDDGELLISSFEFIFPSSGNDIVNLASLNYIIGNMTIATSSGNDIVWSNAGDDYIEGNEGDDILHGGPGNDSIYGHEDNDLLIGSTGDDMLYGGSGNDILYGGAEITIVDKDFVDDVAFPDLTERINIRNLAPPGEPSLGVNDGNLDIDFDATAEITFRQGFAGYNNSLGVYRIAEDGTIEMASLLWENVKDAGIDQTHIIDLPLGADGGEIGFFIIANGDNRNKYDDLDTDEAGNIRFVYDYGGANERDASVYDSGDDITVVYDDGVTEKVLKGYTYHTTEREGSSDLNPDGETHVVSGLADANDDDVLRIGFEDLPNLGDADFEDVLFDVNIVPSAGGDDVDGGDDFLDGGAGDDVLYGGAGDDILVIGDGYDEATGGSGSDIFTFDMIDNFVDVIRDFNAAEGDVINITDLLSGYDPLTNAISDFVRFTASGNDTIVEIDVNGGGDSYQALFIADGGLNATVADMLDSGALIADQAAI